MARTLVQIRKQMDRLTREAGQVRAREVASVVAKIKTAIKYYGLSTTDLFDKPTSARAGKALIGKQKSASKKKVVAKYRDKNTGKTWTGHGKRPAWFVNAIEGGVAPADMAV